HGDGRELRVVGVKVLEQAQADNLARLQGQGIQASAQRGREPEFSICGLEGDGHLLDQEAQVRLPFAQGLFPVRVHGKPLLSGLFPDGQGYRLPPGSCGSPDRDRASSGLSSLYRGWSDPSPLVKSSCLLAACSTPLAVRTSGQFAGG